jgi:hypothetical protein
MNESIIQSDDLKKRILREIERVTDFFKSLADKDTLACGQRGAILSGLSKVENIIYNFHVEQSENNIDVLMQGIKSKIQNEKEDVECYIMSDDLPIKMDGKWLMRGIAMGEDCVDTLKYMYDIDKLQEYCQI